MCASQRESVCVCLLICRHVWFVCQTEHKFKHMFVHVSVCVVLICVCLCVTMCVFECGCVRVCARLHVAHILERMSTNS